MVAAAERPDAFSRALKIDAVRTAQRIKVNLRVKFVGDFPNIAPGRDFPVNQRVKFCKINLPFSNFYSFHTAADINAHHSRHNFIRDRHGRPDRAALARMDIRHNADFAAAKCLLVADT